MDQPELNRRAAEIGSRLAQIRGQVADAGGDPDRTGIVAVTKGRDQLTATAAVAAGLCDLGENYAQELLEKAPGPAAVRWHFIGNLQSNKVRRLARYVELWQSVDRPRLLREIARHSPGARILVQVAARAVPGRGGCDPAMARRLVVEARDLGLHPAGLMSMALPGPADAVRRQFRQVRSLADELELPVRSMGTSGDFTLAVAEGANLLRLGRVLLGDPSAVSE
ncbi:MAG: alanine racemase [bacterium]|nr:alanine racemase [bacterium]MXV89341.1 YggS family pyridoxal phosphate-dependent enzyme [Acidimicrobiia bacterium]MYC45224.1 YggS family pyridoxal phosphate-dependent enzyme [Acidimicrobiia bacterium]MYI18669.1 YggS family pyridoxal phosphate-dependent enzyme [Acidimicrobiia bacterium]